MKVRLELLHKNARIKRVVLKADTVIGRSTECGLRIASNEVSRQHCKICLSDEGVTVRDLGSSNGTFINGYQLEEQTDYEIAPDSELSIGGIKFIVRFEGSKAMQTDGLGSTVDLKPGVQSAPGDTKADKAQDDALEETAQFASAAEAMGPNAHLLDESVETVESNPVELDLTGEDEVVDLEALSDSAILQREEKPQEPAPEPIFPGVEPEQDHDSALGKFFQNFD
jgi:predicted component of type VI protein secretion system